MITQLRLIDFKGFADTTLKLGPFSVIVGTNASGKSNIRDAFRFLHGIGRGYTLAEIIGGKFGFGGQAEWAPLRGAANEIARFGSEKFQIEVEFRLDSYTYAYSICIAIDQSLRSGLRVQHEQLKRIPFWQLDPIFTTHPMYGDPVSRQDDESHLLVRMAKAGEQRKYGERLAVRPEQPALTQVYEFKRVSKTYKDYVAGIISDLAEMRFLDLVPEAMRRPSFPGQSVLGDSGENLPTVLFDICADTSTKAVLLDWIRELTPMDVSDLDFPRDDVSGLVQLVLVEGNGNRVSAYSASDGTLRFLAMLAALLSSNRSGLYFFEEIDNGIHPARMRLLIDLIERQTGKGDIQVVTTTHSPDLLTMIGDSTFETTSVVGRLPRTDSSIIREIRDFPHIAELRTNQGLGRLHASGWLEDALVFTAPDEGEAAP